MIFFFETTKIFLCFLLLNRTQLFFVVLFDLSMYKVQSIV